MEQILKYAEGIGTSQEVINWINTVVKAKTKRHALNQGEVEHILDYLASDAAPTRLRKMSYSAARDAAEKWSKTQQKKGKNLIDGPEDLQTIHDFGDGSKIVKLLTKSALQREGYLMSHCVGSYDLSRTSIYSYRDAKNMPHATFEVTTSNGEVQQIKGKGNGPISPKYVNAILAFLTAINQKPRPSEMSNLGYYHVPDEAMDLVRQFVDSKGMPAPFVVLHGDSYLYSGQSAC